MKAVLHSFTYSLEFLREQVADVADPHLVIQPAGMVNHPAWTIGHLAFICEQLAGVVGLPAWLPGDWINSFGSGSTPVPDPKGYESKESLLSVLGDAQQRINGLWSN